MIQIEVLILSHLIQRDVGHLALLFVGYLKCTKIQPFCGFSTIGGFYKLLSRDFETGFEQIVGFHEGVIRCIMNE